MFVCEGFATDSADKPLSRTSFERRDVGERDVKIDILFCGVCHSDLHQARNEWHNTIYPCLPGHEIVGRVSAVGPAVTKFKVGDLAGVGCMVGSCQNCPNCSDGLEQYCDNGFVGTYNGIEKETGKVTMGGYSEAIVVDEGFTLRIPENLELAAVAPLLCAGITTYSPLRRWNVQPGQKVGIVGLGGLGHMGVKLAHAMGAHVVLFTTSPGKAADARRLGADEVIVCVAADHDVNAYLNLLKRDGTMCQVGAPERPLSVAAFSVIWKRRSFAGSLIGGIAETQEMLDFCAEHGITSDIEMIDIADIEAAYARMLKSDVKYRFVIDMATLKTAA